LAELISLAEEFYDRFGPPPDTVDNLFYQLKMKLLAEAAGLSSVTVDSGQLVLRFPDGELPPDLPDLDSYARLGKTALWMPYAGSTDWPDRLQDILEVLSKISQEKRLHTPTGSSSS
jgi:transcription-repair coupling factor (superfamily II helicase)